ncbi:MAG: formylglycine-generating enzyme family protein [Candidatus Latescibacteria bacterium]|nr:formylglycine-generating enzyme family protein [Candidatus Latescibacterota bacterium]
MKEEEISEQEGTVEINCIFPGAGQEKAASPENITSYAFIYLYKYGNEFSGKQEIEIINKIASVTFKFKEGMNFAFKVVGYDSNLNITYQGKSGRVNVAGNQTISVNIIMKKYGYVTISAGTYEMGSEDGENDEKPVHTVYLDAFEMSATEVTVKQWTALMSYLLSEDEKSFLSKIDDTISASNITWFEAIEFCNRLSEFYRLNPCYDETTMNCDYSKNGYRLPTEAEWEYACRAGTTSEYNTGDSEEDLDKTGWYLTNSSELLHPVGEKESNNWGLYDMHGNIGELCNDYYSAGYYKISPENNPHGPNTVTSIHVFRGGSYISECEKCRSSARSSLKYNVKSQSVGFRVVRSI